MKITQVVEAGDFQSVYFNYRNEMEVTTPGGIVRLQMSDSSFESLERQLESWRRRKLDKAKDLIAANTPKQETDD